MRTLALAALLALVVAAPLVSAEPLSAFEEPHHGTDQVWDVTVSEAEAGQMRALVFRNAVGRTFTFAVFDASGAEIFNRTGQRGIQTLPALEAGEYRFFVRAEGEFQITARALERGDLARGANGTVNGTHAFVLAPTQAYDVRLTGSARVEWWPLTESPREIALPANETAAAGGAYVLTVRGQDAPYGIELVPGAAPTATSQTPGVGAFALLVSFALLAFVKRRT